MGSHLFFVRVGSLIVRAIGGKPLALIRNAYCYLGKASQIVIMHKNSHRLAWSRASRFESRSVAL
jgi:hypothetical protein